MKRSRAFILVLIAMLPFAAGCSSNRKPKVVVDQPNNIPADIPSQFLDRYGLWVSGREQKEFKKLLTDEERQAFIDKFWAERDPDPSTPENEKKQEIDDRIDDIASERFFGSAGATGLLFRSNGGFWGDLAKVYLLHGEPDAMDTIEGSSFVPLMLWIYSNPENGSILYAFLFYKKGGSGSYSLFSQDAYKMDACRAIYEVATTRMYNYMNGGAQACSEDLYQVYNNIYQASGKAGILDGNVFAWSLFNFSQNASLLQGAALDPPKPAAEIAKQSKARVIGEAPKLIGTAGTDYILSSCEKCNSLIPAELFLDKSLAISSPLKNFDWTVKGESAELLLKYRVVFQGHNGGKLVVFEDVVAISLKKSFLEKNPETNSVVEILSPEKIAAIPSGTYQVNVYVKNTMTKKYNAWDREFIKK